MKWRSRALIVSTAIIWMFGLRTIYRAFAPWLMHPSERPVFLPPWWDVLAQSIAGLFWCGLGVGNWWRDGAWGRGICTLGAVILPIQWYLLYLAVADGHLPLTGPMIARSLFTSFEDLAMGASSYLAYADYRRRKANPPPPLAKTSA